MLNDFLGNNTKYKRRTSPGPDEIPTEILKEMDDGSIVDLLNQWWNEADILTEMLKARVVQIYRKGDTRIHNNYRPIFLLNALHKMYAGIGQINSNNFRQTRIGNIIWISKRKKHGIRNTVSRVAEHRQGTYIIDPIAHGTTRWKDI